MVHLLVPCSLEGGYLRNWLSVRRIWKIPLVDAR
jgi:hypothetical protein